MAFNDELAALFSRDLARLIQEVQAFSDEDALWEQTGGVANSVGNLALHLEGNLREYVGRQLGQVSYQRAREAEFSTKGVPKTELIARLETVQALVVRVVSGLSAEQMEAYFPENVLATPLSTRQYLLHLFGHLNYHLGQVDYLRRVLTGDPAIQLAALPAQSRS